MKSRDKTRIMTVFVAPANKSVGMRKAGEEMVS